MSYHQNLLTRILPPLLVLAPVCLVVAVLVSPPRTGPTATIGHGRAGLAARASCPVCGRSVRASAALAQIVFEDGSRVDFDRSEDMFRYLLERHRFGPDRRGLRIEGTWVTSFFERRRFPARGAYFVVCDDAIVSGAQLVAHRTRNELEAFLRQHRGERIVRYAQILEDGLPSGL